ARARPREAAALELEDLRQAVDCGDLDEPAVDPQLAEEDDAPRLTRGERSKHATDGAVFAPVRPFLQRQSEAIYAEPAGVGGQRRETLAERLLPRDEAAPDDGDDHREGERDAADDERRAQRPGTQSRRRDAKRRPGRAAYHRRTAYTGVASTPEYNRRRDRRAARLPRPHREAARGAPPVRGGGNPAPAAVPGRVHRRLHDRRRGAVDVHEPLGVRELRRARASPCRAAGRRRVEGLPRPAAAAPAHPEEPDPDPHLLLAAAVRLERKVAVVTGGAQGIGAAIADGLRAEGAAVVVADLSPSEDGIRADVSREDDVRRMVGETVERHGRLDILINNAGLYASLAMRPFTEIPLEEWRQVMDVNVASMFLTCRAAVPVMRE